MNQAMKKICIVHGWTYSTAAWDALTAALRAAGYEVRLLHVPGLTAASDKVWTLDSYVEWLRGELAGEQDIILIGHSNGGRIAIAYAARYGQAAGLSRLILIDSAGVVHDELPLRIKRAFFGFMARIGKPLAAVPSVRKAFYRLIGGKDYGNAAPNMRATMATLIRQDLVPVLPQVRIPTLIIWGTNDTATPLSDAHIMATGIADSTLVAIDGAGHSPHKSHAERVSREIVAWLAR